MSFLAVEWASEAAPAADAFERLILMRMANRADDDGTGAYQSVPSLARMAMCDTETVKRRLRALLKRGVIALGDQSLAAHIRQDRRPKVYDLMIPADWYSAAQLAKVNQHRAELGRPELTAAVRPALAPAPARARRADHGVSNPARRPKKANQSTIPTVDPTGTTAALQEPSTAPVDNSTGGSSRAVDGGSSRAVDGGSLSRPTGALVEPQLQPTKTNSLEKTNQPTAAPADADPSNEVGWLGGPRPEQEPAPVGARDVTPPAMTRGERLLRALPPTHRLAMHALPAARDIVDQALTQGWSKKAIVNYLTDNTAQVRNPAGVVKHRLTTLAADLAATQEATTLADEEPWCGSTGSYIGMFASGCDPHTRMRETDDEDRRPFYCPLCHPRATHAVVTGHSAPLVGARPS